MHNRGIPVDVNVVYDNQIVNYIPSIRVNGMESVSPHDMDGILGGIVNELQSRPEHSTLRCALFNLVSSQGYQNQWYASMVETAVGIYNNTDLSIDEIVSMTFGDAIVRMVEQYPELKQTVDSAQARELTKLNQVSIQIDNILGGGQPQMQQGYHQHQMGRPGMQQGYGYQQRPVYGQPAMGNRMQPGGYRQQQTMGSRLQGNPRMQPGAVNTPRMQPTQNATGRLVGNRAQPQQSNQRQPSTTTVPTGFGKVEEVEEQIQQPSNTPEILGAPVYKLDSKSVFKPVLTDELIMLNDAVYYKGDIVNYEDHEGDKRLIKLHREQTRDNNTVVKWVESKDLQEISTVKLAEDEEKEITFDLAKPLFVTDLMEGITPLEMVQNFKLGMEQMYDGGYDGLSEATYNVTGMQQLKRFITNKQTDLDFVNELKSALTASKVEALSILNILSEAKGSVNDALWFGVEEILINKVNALVRAWAGLEIEIEDDLVGSWPDLLEAVTDESNSLVANTLLKEIVKTLSSALVVVVDEIEDRFHSIVLGELVSVTILNVHSKELGLELPDEYCSLTAAIGTHNVTNELIELLVEIIKRRSYLTKNYVITQDGIEFCVYLSDVGVNNVVVSVK